MDASQLQTLKAAIAAETSLSFVAAREAGATGEMAAFYNVEATPAFYVWRSNYGAEQITAAIDAGITQVDGLTANKRQVLLWWSERAHDARLAQTQAAIEDMCGSQNTLKAAVYAGAKRKLTRGEKLFATGGSGAEATPAIANFEGFVRNEDIVLALNS